ncbi:uncharacterized protein LOC6559600 [Drosophila grimshawi]|uniref:GH19995 n=1 Tax=Drosophila grimshawi TaxID=7222 RepID=B4J827_DROGR|nr:uncharacterized protein LOC6559600 [Drosophila grimshawi]EDW02257.1 GH19995 [Drosophila grimshawi]
MSHLLRRTKKSCLKLLRKISTSKQLFVQRLDEDDEDEQEMEQEEEEEHINTATTNDKQYACDSSTNTKNTNNNKNIKPNPSVQYCQEVLSQLKEEEEEDQRLDIQFDLMHYKENVRYLRHTPSNSNSNSSVDLRQVASPQCSFSVSVGSQLKGQYHNVIIVEQPPNDAYPIVKWDINGNSLDEEQFDLRQHWAAFDSRWRQLQAVQSGQSGKRMGSGHSQRSSHHSSSCTLETWIDDAELGLGDDLQNLLQTNHNKNNCNNCLKSF